MSIASLFPFLLHTKSYDRRMTFGRRVTERVTPELGSKMTGHPYNLDLKTRLAASLKSPVW